MNGPEHKTPHENIFYVGDGPLRINSEMSDGEGHNK